MHTGRCCEGPREWLQVFKGTLGSFACASKLMLLLTQDYHQYIDDNLPAESPHLYGLHPNAEMGFLTVTSERLFRTVLELQPKESEAAGGSGTSREEQASQVLSLYGRN